MTARLNVGADVTTSAGATFSSVRVAVTNYGQASIWNDREQLVAAQATAVQAVAPRRYRVVLATGETWDVVVIDAGCGCSGGRKVPASRSGPQVVPT